ncbi:uncharacterized protein [Procambarus clarkii]|uniref:uncharacterized protein n=1 Tax=Procambarus clarkii TaxID=6728 RepID=UPI003742E4B1
METQSPEELATSHGNINMDSESSQSVEEGEYQDVLTRQQKKRIRQDARRSVDSNGTLNGNDKRMKNDAETDVDKRTERCQEGEGQRRWRLLFPASCTLAYHQKLLWTVTLGREHRKFEPLLKEGVNRPYLTILDPEFILDDQRFVWAKRHLIKGEARSQVVALVRGEVPEKVFITGAGYRHVAKYVEEPIICLKCCRWGHKSWSCQNDPRCRFCGKSHLSNVCRNRLNLGEKIVPRCCNCGGVHNASSAVCSKRPSMGVIRPVNVTEQARALTQTPGAQQNSLPQTAPVNRTNAWVKESPLLRQAQATSSHATTQDSGSDNVTVNAKPENLLFVAI